LHGQKNALTVKAPGNTQVAKPNAGDPQALFDAHIPYGGRSDRFFHYDVAGDGKHFLVNTVAAGKASPAPTHSSDRGKWR